MVDNSMEAYSALRKMQNDSLDLIFCNMTTYTSSATFAPIIRDMNAPVVLVALQPLQGLDYSKACTFMQLENNNICSGKENW
jgi:L-arabinose isomerase